MVRLGAGDKHCHRCRPHVWRKVRNPSYFTVSHRPGNVDAQIEPLAGRNDLIERRVERLIESIYNLRDDGPLKIAAQALASSVCKQSVQELNRMDPACPKLLRIREP